MHVPLSRFESHFPSDTILVADRSGSEQPFSRGLLASSIMPTGLTPGSAHLIASEVAAELRRDGIRRITSIELSQVASLVISRMAGEPIAARYDAWCRVTRSTKPIIVLLGGASGTGKSTIATRLASRLSITRVIPTDAVREVMRAFVPKSLVPELHRSSFEPPPELQSAPFETIYEGFRRQCNAVASGVASVVSRMVTEREDAIIEGVHVLPGLDLGPAAASSAAVVVPILITVGDEAAHRAHFMHRLETHHGREPHRYLERLATIREIDRRLRAEAREHKVPVVDSTYLDDALHRIVQIVVDRAELSLTSDSP